MKTILLLISSVVFLISQNAINGAGATFPYPIYAAWAYDYYKTEDIKLNYQPIGSGGGVQQIKNRTVDFGASDAPVSPEKLKKLKLLQFPAIIGGVVPIVNLRGIKSGELKLGKDVLAKIFLEEITMWNDPLIVKDNPGLKLPSKKIVSIHRADGSGTTAIFTNYLAAMYPKFKEKIGVGKSVKWIGGLAYKGNQGVSNYVKRIPNSIGYVEYAYAKENKLTYAQVQNQSGNFVSPNTESFKSAADFAKWNMEEHFYLWLVNAPGKKSWPITGASFILLAKDKAESNKKAIAFYDWCFKKGDQTAIAKTYIPLPASLKDKIRQYWNKYVNPAISGN